MICIDKWNVYLSRRRWHPYRDGDNPPDLHSVHRFSLNNGLTAHVTFFTTVILMH